MATSVIKKSEFMKSVGTVNLNTLTESGFYSGTSDGTVSLSGVDGFFALVFRENTYIKQFVVGEFGYGTTLYMRYSSNSGSTWANYKLPFTAV